MSPPNLALRFLLELSLLTVLGVWGAALAPGSALAAIPALVTPLVAAAIWGLFVSPRARVAAPAAARLAIELALFTAGAASLYSMGRVWWALAFGAAVLVHELWRLAEARRGARDD